MTECAVETQVEADIGAIYRHLFGIRGVAVGPTLQQRDLGLVYDLSANGKLSATLTGNRDLNAVSINGATAAVTFQNSTQGIITLEAIRWFGTYPANNRVYISIDGTLAWSHRYTNANGSVSVRPSVVVEETSGQPSISDPGPGNMWLPPSSEWTITFDAGGAGDVVTMDSLIYTTPFGVQPP